MFCMGGARARPSPVIFNWFLTKVKENGNCGQSYPVSYGRPSSELNLVFSRLGEPHLSVFLDEERPRDSSERRKIIDVSPFPVPPKVQDVPSPSAGIVYLPHQKSVCPIPVTITSPSPSHPLLTPRPFIQKGRCKRHKNIFIKHIGTHYVSHFGPYGTR